MSKITQYVRHLAVVAIATLLAQCAWAAEYTVAIPAETETLALTSALSEYTSVTASDTITITAENTAPVTFDLNANLTAGTLKITGDGEIVFTKSNDATVAITDLDLQERTAQVTFKNFVPSMTNVKPKNIAYNAATIGSYPYAIADGSQLTFDLADDTAISTVFCPSAMSSRVMRLTKKGSGVLTLNGQSYNKGIWTVAAGAIKQGNNHAGSGSQAWGGPFGRMSTGAYGTAGEGGAGMNQNVYVDVKDGAYVDLNGKENCYSYRIAGDGLGNGAIVSSTSGLTDSKISVLSIELAADASVGGDQNIGLITANFAGTTLNLGTYTLTKKGTGGFFIANATINGNGSFALEGGVLQLNTPSDKTLSNVISGSGTFKKTGNGNLTLSGKNNNMTGPITIAAGTLTVGNYDALGTYAANQTRAITVESGATLNNQNHDMTGRKLVISGTGSGSNGAAYITTGNGAMMREYRDGTIVLAADATIKIDNGRGIKTQYMEYVFGGHTLTKIGSADLTMRNNWTADTDSGRFVVAAGGIAFDTVGVRFSAIDMAVGENGTIKRNLANNTLAVKSLTLESGATISDSKTAISVSGALTVGETIKLPDATEGMVVMTIAGDKPTTLPTIVDSELALAFDGNDLKVVTPAPNTITFTVGAAPENAVRVVTVDGAEVEVTGNAFAANVGASVVVTYKPAAGYIGNTVNATFTVANPMQTTEITAPTDMNIQKVVAIAYTQLVPAAYVECASLEAAIAVEGAIAIMLTDDINITEPITVEKSSLIDLDEHTITTTSRAFVVQGEGVTLSIGNGSIVGPTGAAAAALDGKAIITVDGARLEFSDGTLTCGGSGSDGMYGVYVLNGGTAIFGYEEEGVAYGPTISSHFAAIGTNNTTAPATITIHGGEYTAAANTTTERWSYFCAAIYAPSAGSYTINGGTFNGQYAISSRYSNVNQTIAINGGSLNGSVVDIFVDEVIGTAAEDPVRTITIATGVEATIPEGYSWVDGTLTKDPAGPKSWDDVDDDTEVSDIVSEETAEALADSNVTAKDIATWAAAKGVEFSTTTTIPVNALIFNVAPSAAPGVAEEAPTAEEAAAEVLKEVIEAEKVDLATLLEKAVNAGEGGLTITSLSTEYPMATIKLIPAKKINSTETAKFFQLSIELK